MRTIVTVPSNQQPANGIVSTLSLLSNKTNDIKVVHWNPASKPAFDMFDELKPDLVLCDGQTAPSMSKVIKEYGTKLIICGSMPPHGLEPDLILFSEQVPEMIIKHCEYPSLAIKNAADISKYRNGKFSEDKSTEILYYASQKEPQNNEASILGLLSGLKWQFKIIGYRRPLLQYVGRTSVYETADFFASAKITIDINSAQQYDVAAQSGFCISNKSGLFPHIEEFSPEEWEDTIEVAMQDEHKRGVVSSQAHEEVIANHTYFHRLAEVFEKLGWNDEQQLTLETLSKVVSK